MVRDQAKDALFLEEVTVSPGSTSRVQVAVSAEEI
jgi:hypothetical protein